MNLACDHCCAAAERPWHGFAAHCTSCTARAIARSESFRRVRLAGKLDRDYVEAIASLDLSHEQVKEAAELDRMCTFWRDADARSAAA